MPQGARDEDARWKSLGGLARATRLWLGHQETPRQESSIVAEGAMLVIRFRGVMARLPRRAGLVDLAILLAREGQDVPVAELQRGSGQAGRGRAVLAFDQVEAPVDAEPSRLRRDRGRDADAVMDAECVADVEREIARLEGEGDAASLERARELAAYLETARNVRGEARLLGSARDRGRCAVRKRIVAALELLRRELPALFEHLGGEALLGARAQADNVALRTGHSCSYRPAERVGWNVVLAPAADNARASRARGATRRSG